MGDAKRAEASKQAGDSSARAAELEADLERARTEWEADSLRLMAAAEDLKAQVKQPGGPGQSRQSAVVEHFFCKIDARAHVASNARLNKLNCTTK